jgi:hypothetical protein
LWAAYIGAAGALLAAIIGGVFVLFANSGHGSPAVTFLVGQSDLAILSVSFTRTRTGEIVDVTGIARQLPAYEAVYAVAKPRGGNAGRTVPAVPAPAPAASSWFVGGPASVSKDGLWSARIYISSLRAGDLTIAAVEIGGPTPPACPTSTCIPAPGPSLPSIAQIRSDLRSHGPDSAYVAGTSALKHVTISAG